MLGLHDTWRVETSPLNQTLLVLTFDFISEGCGVRADGKMVGRGVKVSSCMWQDHSDEREVASTRDGVRRTWGLCEAFPGDTWLGLKPEEESVGRGGRKV